MAETGGSTAPGEAPSRPGLQRAGGAPPNAADLKPTGTAPMPATVAAGPPGGAPPGQGAPGTRPAPPPGSDLKPTLEPQETSPAGQSAPAPTSDTSGRLIATGITGLDAQYGGGLPAGNLMLLVAEPMNAPAIFADQYAAQGAKDGERIFYYTLERTADEVKERIKPFLEKEDAMARIDIIDGFHLQFKGLARASRERIGAADGEDVLDHLEGLLEDETLQAPFRIIIDSLTELMAHYEHDRVFRTLRTVRGLVQHLQGSAVVTMVGPMHADEEVALAKHLAHGVIEFAVERKGFGVYPVLMVSKMRGVAESQRMLLFKETDQGLWLESTKRVH